MHGMVWHVDVSRAQHVAGMPGDEVWVSVYHMTDYCMKRQES